MIHKVRDHVEILIRRATCHKCIREVSDDWGYETQVCSLWSSVIISISQDIAAPGLSFPAPWPHKCDIKQKVNTRSEEERYFINNTPTTRCETTFALSRI